ncbi:MAG: xanthine dehydrogenase family protein subunit M [Anaerolineales bacterium]|nr:xanthine dehydrogenase family protein subunit M [Anaerolineales bacterium]
MKPAPFRYVAPTTINDAVRQIAEFGYDAKILAGGQSLIPTMNFRLAQPQVLIDLNGVGELAFLETSPAGGLRIGAMTRQRTIERSALVAKNAPLLHATMPHIAHVQIRNRGTVGGSLAHADPAAELPAVMVALAARFKLRSVRGERWVPADQFYLDLFTTALEPDELIFEIEVPPPPPRTGWSIQELARRRGDYALVGLAATVQLDETGRCSNARLIYLSVGAGPTPAPAAAAMLLGKTPDAALTLEAARAAAHQDIEPMADIHATAAYRRQLVAVLGQRALREAFARAKESS